MNFAISLKDGLLGGGVGVETGDSPRAGRSWKAAFPQR